MADLKYSIEDLPKGIKVCVTKEHRFGTDAFLLSDFAAVKTGETAIDLGSGCGIITALWFSRAAQPRIAYAVELQEQAFEQLQTTVSLSGLKDRLIPVHADLRSLSGLIDKARADVVACNPPYKTGGTGILSQTDSGRIARHETMCTISDICAAGSSLLKFGGRLCLCQRPERLCDVITEMRANGLEPKRLRFVHKNPSGAPWLFLIEGRKGAKPFLKVEAPLLMEKDDGSFSDEVLRIYGKTSAKEE